MWRTNLLEKTLLLGKIEGGRRRGHLIQPWDGWMVSLTWSTWVWASSGSQWWTGKPGVLQSLGLQRIGHEFEQALGVSDGQGSLVCCSPWGWKESDMTKRLNWTGKPIQPSLQKEKLSYWMVNKVRLLLQWETQSQPSKSDIQTSGKDSLEKNRWCLCLLDVTEAWQLCEELSANVYHISFH